MLCQVRLSTEQHWCIRRITYFLQIPFVFGGQWWRYSRQFLSQLECMYNEMVSVVFPVLSQVIKTKVNFRFPHKMQKMLFWCEP